MDISNTLFGFYRGLVVGNKDLEFKGRIIVWVPQTMPEVEKDRGLLALPANNPVGGRNEEGNNEHHYMGTSYIPKRGSWVFVFFESGNPSNPYYFGACDLENTTVLPECQLGGEPEDKWVIFKSHEGRTVVISDDPDDARVEITGKKRKMLDKKEIPTGDKDSVYEIDDNQTTILLDEREGKEKILVRTYKGDFIHIDIDQQNLQIDFENDINIECRGKFSLKAKKDIHIKTNADLHTESVLSTHRKAGVNIYDKSGVSHHTQGGSLIARDASLIEDNTGSSDSAEGSTPTVPAGERDT